VNHLHYKLIGKLPVPCTLMEWAHWMEAEPTARIVKRTTIGTLYVSTVFLGIDHNWDPDPNAEPLLFETMVFDDLHDAYQTRCTTWDQAELMHEVAVAEATARWERALGLLKEEQNNGRVETGEGSENC
jgi:hypothetical protein